MKAHPIGLTNKNEMATNYTTKEVYRGSNFIEH